MASPGGTPLAVAKDGRLLRIVHLKDIVKRRIRERFAELRRMGIRTIMIPGHNPMTAAAIAAEANPAVADTIPRLCLDGSNRQPKFILPIVRDRLAARLPVDGLALEVALWARYCAGHDEAGNPISIPDERARQLNAKALQAKTEPLEFLRQPEIFGDLAEAGPFADRYSAWFVRLCRDGVRRTLKHYLTSASRGDPKQLY